MPFYSNNLDLKKEQFEERTQLLMLSLSLEWKVNEGKLVTCTKA